MCFKDEALSQFKEAIATAEKVIIGYWRVHYFYSVALEMANRGFKQKSIFYFRKAIAETVKVGETIRPTVIDRISSAIVGAKLGEEAVVLFYELIQMAEDSGSDYFCSIALSKISGHISNVEPKEAVLALFKRLVDVAKKIKDNSYRLDALRTITMSSITAGIKIKIPQIQ